MEQLSELFWSASIAELQQGYIFSTEEQHYTCLLCGYSADKGIIYPDGGHFYEAEKFMQRHIHQEHRSTFDHLLNLDKRFTGLTDHQKKLLTLFRQGLSDADIITQLGGGSTSTIRNHRFTLREKEKQAKLFLAIMGMLDHKPAPKDEFISIHKTAAMVDERYAITKDDNEKILRTYFPDGLSGPLSEFPTKEKRKVAVLRHIAKRFESGRQYTEKEANAMLKEIYPDYVTIRRYLVEYGFLDRQKDGSLYWLKC